MGYINTKMFVELYLGKKYGAGTQGCLRFVSEFYEKTFDIIVPPDYFEMLKVLKSYLKKPRFGDVVCVKNHPIVVNHLGIYLSDNEFMHGGALQDGDEVILSRITDLPWRDRIVGYLRHPKNDD